MKNFPTMTATVHADTAHRTVTVVVEHAGAQRFSRAVLPRANKEFKRWISAHVMFGELRRVATSLAWHDVKDTTDRYLTTATFTY
jgi:hypothetical protein